MPRPMAISLAIAGCRGGNFQAMRERKFLASVAMYDKSLSKGAHAWHAAKEKISVFREVHRHY